jgi:hypothetical protein
MVDTEMSVVSVKQGFVPTKKLPITTLRSSSIILVKNLTSFIVDVIWDGTKAVAAKRARTINQ